VPMRFLQPFAGVGYGMGVGIVLDPAHADFNGGAIGAGSYYWGGVHGTWFWVDPTRYRDVARLLGFDGHIA
jgi:CubicO group peptidase (beta-lactamase class C family)